MDIPYLLSLCLHFDFPHGFFMVPNICFEEGKFVVYTKQLGGQLLAVLERAHRSTWNASFLSQCIVDFAIFEALGI